MKSPLLPIYVPAVRLKQGEYRGLHRLAPDIIEKIRPRLVVPPPKERDPEKQRPLTKDEIIYGTGRRIAEHWPLREAFLDVNFLFDEFGDAESIDWLPRMFSVAREAGAKPIPVATLADTLGPQLYAFRDALAEGTTRIALRVKSDEIDSDLEAIIKHAVSALGLSPSRCTILADFADADFSDPGAVALIAQAALENLQAIGRWGQIVFQGTNYPEVNPAEPGQQDLVPRNEWLAWKKAVKLDSNTSDHLVFGDYAADCAKFNFGKSGGGIPIRHYRYTTPENWMVVRGIATGETGVAMQSVCERILKSGMFAGRTFSSADEYIFKTAKGLDGPGNGTTWREINTTHHITRVVRDIGEIKGFKFVEREVGELAFQPSLFEPR
jgi:hypothetical protein